MGTGSSVFDTHHLVESNAGKIDWVTRLPSETNASSLLPPQRAHHRGRMTVVVDMDETLVFAERFADRDMNTAVTVAAALHRLVGEDVKKQRAR